MDPFFAELPLAVTEAFTRLSGAYYSGGWATTSATTPLISPATGAEYAHTATCGVPEAEEAARVAADAQRIWQRTTPFKRSEIIETWFDLIMEHRDELGAIMAVEMGKPVTEATGEAVYAAQFVKFYAAEAVRTYGHILPDAKPGRQLQVLAEPVGPVFAITPWNFPAAMITRKAAPALAAGCTFIVKPAPQTPVTALRLAELWEEAGGPMGTFQVLPTTNDAELASHLIADSRIRKITFTGSTPVGKLLYEQAAKTVKRISLELGGHAPVIVFADANLRTAAIGAAQAKFRNAGQTCVCANRLYVERSVYREFMELFTKEVEKLQVGHPLDPTTTVGPLVNAAAVKKVRKHIADALAEGAKVEYEAALPDYLAENPLYVPPTVVGAAHAGMISMNEETFGPLAPVALFDTEGEVIEAANNTPYGLAAYVFTENIHRANRVAAQLEYGIVGVNEGLPSAAHAPFGGFKESGIGKEGSAFGIEEYLRYKYVAIGGE